MEKRNSSLPPTIPDEAPLANGKDSPMVSVEHVSMVFNIANQKLNSLKEYFVAVMKRELMFKEFRALNDISLEVQKGDVFGILGVNGSGKSTLLKIISGILEPTSGHVTVRGSIAPLIELGAGFDLELTARENIYLNGALLGYSKQYIDDKFDEIVRFAEVEKFLDMPLKNYSSGMVSRVAFAVATAVVPDILIVDEALSVGDFMFRKKCEKRIRELIDEHGTTILLVSHSDSQIERLCNKAIWIDMGNMRMKGSAKDVVRMYRMFGGRSCSSESESAILRILNRPLDPPDDFSFSFWGTDLYAIDKSIKLSRQEELGGDTAIIAIATQHLGRLLANVLGAHIKAPVILASPQGLREPSLELLRQMNPKSIIAINSTAEEESGFDFVSELKSFGDPKIELIENRDLFELSLAIWKRGNDFHPWTPPLVVKHEDFLPLLVSYPLLANEPASPIIFTWDNVSQEDVVNRLAEKHNEHRPLIFEAEDGSESGVRLARKMRRMDGSKSIADPPSEQRPINLIVTPRLTSIALSVLGLAVEENAVIAMYESNDLDKVLEFLEMIDSLRPVAKVTFIGDNSSFTQSDKDLIISVALDGLPANVN